MKKRNRFANVIIAICIVTTIVIAAAVIYEYHRLCIPITADILKVFYGFFGGELLIVALRQIFGSDIVKPKEDKQNNTTYGGSI